MYPAGGLFKKCFALNLMLAIGFYNMTISKNNLQYFDHWQKFQKFRFFHPKEKELKYLYTKISTFEMY